MSVFKKVKVKVKVKGELDQLVQAPCGCLAPRMWFEYPGEEAVYLPYCALHRRLPARVEGGKVVLPTQVKL